LAIGTGHVEKKYRNRNILLMFIDIVYSKKILEILLCKDEMEFDIRISNIKRFVLP